MKEVIAIVHTDQHLDLDNIPTWKTCMKEGDNLARKYNVPLFFGGDMFESRKAQPQELLNVFGDYLKESYDIEKYCIPGNHDKTDYASERSYLDEFSYHPNFNLITDYRAFYKSDSKVAIHLIPYFEEGPIYLKYLEQANKVIGKINVLLTHIAIINGGNNNDDELIINGMDPSLFSKFDNILCGHYHQKNPPYIGSLFQQNFSEDTNKGFTLLYDDGTISQIKSTFKEYQTIIIDLDIINQKELEDLIKETLKEEKYTRLEFAGSYEKIKSINQNYYKSLGFDVKLKRDKIDKNLKESQLQGIIQFNKTSIITEFEKFCNENQLELEVGLKYLNNTINK